jgi:hypothetical protein
MLSLLLCLLAFGLAYFFGKRSLVAGLVAVLTVGYFYGILRANIPETYSHFIFDASILGLYLTQLLPVFRKKVQPHLEPIRAWVTVLIAWPLLLFFLPLQDYFVQLVGLRGNVFLLPFILLGARLDGDDIRKLAIALAILGGIAFAFAGAEYYLGVERFYPENEVTQLIYRSVVDEDYENPDRLLDLRIPATFTGAHAYAGTMVMAIAFLFTAWSQTEAGSRKEKGLLLAGMVVSIVGIFMAAVRTPVIILALLLVASVFPGRLRIQSFTLWVIMLAGVAWIVSSDERLQRFMTLKDVDFVSERISWSVNDSFLELVTRYPMGNGLGGGGTSIPYFLEDRIIPPTVFMENEYARIVLEQGLFGLALWLAFLLWLFTRRPPRDAHDWFVGRRLVWLSCVASFATGMIGIGLFTSIPGTTLLLIGVGWISTHQARSQVQEPEFSTPTYGPDAYEVLARDSG